MLIERMLEEEVELDKMFASEVAPADATQPPSTDVDTFDLEDNPTDVVEPRDAEDDKKTRQSWKQRFIGYKASTDVTISNLRKENLRFVAQIQALEKSKDELLGRITELMSRDKDPFGDGITPEELELIGPEAVDVVRKATKKATETAITPVVAELNRIKAEAMAKAQRESEVKSAAEYNRFAGELGDLVGDYVTINHDPKFAEYMMEFDHTLGEKRIDAFRRAEDYRDAHRVADFFNDFKESIPKSKRDMLEDHITPTGNNSSPAPVKAKVETFSMREVNKFYDDFSRGAYRNKRKEADELEARITKAYVEGRITD